MIDNSRIIFDQKIRTENKVKIISGTDEAGRGAMAGPIVVASVILPTNYANPKIKDSKKLSESERNKLFDEIKNIALDFTIAIISSNDVDLLNPKKASQIGMIKTLNDLKIKPDIALIDAEKIVVENLRCDAYIKGDDKSQSIAAASIIAKVTRDNIMINFKTKYPQYGFELHKGYCTKMHIQKLSENGITKIHRKSYKPVKIFLSSSK